MYMCRTKLGWWFQIVQDSQVVSLQQAGHNNDTQDSPADLHYSALLEKLSTPAHENLSLQSSAYWVPIAYFYMERECL